MLMARNPLEGKAGKGRINPECNFSQTPGWCAWASEPRSEDCPQTKGGILSLLQKARIEDGHGCVSSSVKWG